MSTRSLVLTAAGALLAPSLVALATAAPASAGAAAEASVSVTRTFSPDGDGVKDTAAVRYTLSGSPGAVIEVRRSWGGPVVRRVELEQSRGTHTWRWDGRNDEGGRVRDGDYEVVLFVTPFGSRSDRTTVDRTFTASVRPTTTYGAPDGSPVRVYPRTRVVTDTVGLSAELGERFVRRAELLITDRTGRVVWRRDVNRKAHWPKGRDVRWTARRGGEALPPGRYTAQVRGTDRAGNTGASNALRIRVSGRRLVWRTRTETFAASEHRTGQCSLTTANGCGDVTDCGSVVPSALYAGGLSYRSAVCEGTYRASRAQSYHLYKVPEARGVRGLHAVRVAFVATPTSPGGTDVGTLEVPSRAGTEFVESGSGGGTGWVEEPQLGGGVSADVPYGPVDPAAYWTYRTVGTASVDVATFTVGVRYLAVAD